MGFLSNGLIIAVLKADGTQPEASGLLTMRRTDCSRTGRSSLKRLDGIGSNKQVVDLEEITNFDSVSGEIISNCEKMQMG